MQNKIREWQERGLVAEGAGQHLFASQKRLSARQQSVGNLMRGNPEDASPLGQKLKYATAKKVDGANDRYDNEATQVSPLRAKLSRVDLMRLGDAQDEH